MFRIIRVPAILDKFFDPLRSHFHWNQWMYVRLLVVAMACMWGRRHGATLSRYLDGEHPRTRCNNFFLVARWDPEAALRQKAPEWLRALRPGQGETIDLSIDDAKKAKRGQAMDAIAKRKDPTTEAYIRGHPSVCAILVCRDHVIPFGLRLSVKQAHRAALGLPCRTTPELAAPLLRAFKPSTGVTGVALVDAFSLGPTVVKAGREQPWPVASTLQRNRRLGQHGWQLKAGRYGRPLCRRRRTDTLALAQPYGPVRSRGGDAGWLEVSSRGPLPVVFSRKGTAKKLLGLVTDTPELSATDVIRTDEKRWTIAPWLKDLKPLLGLGHDQNRPYWAAVTHRHLVCFASALLPHLRIARQGAQGHRTHHKIADLSTAAAQEQLRRLLWEDLMTSLKEKRQGQSDIEELERLCVA
jgi:hypothetical protein